MTAIFWQLSDFLQNHMEASDLSKHLDGPATNTKSNEDSNVTVAESPARTWLHLVERLNTVTTDLRPEVRNTAIHTELRIFGSYDLPPASWNACFRHVLLRAIQGNVSRQKWTLESSTAQDTQKAWNETSQLLVTGFADLFAANVEAVMKLDSWSDLWEAIAENVFKSYLQLGQRFLHGVVYSALAKVLQKIMILSPSMEDIDVLLVLWLEYSPADAQAADDDESTEPFERYVSCFQGIYRVFHLRMMTGMLEKCTHNLLRCVQQCHGIKYGSDVDNMTPLQYNVSLCLAEIHSKCRAAQSLIVKALANAIALPFSRPTESKQGSQLTFVAFSKASMDLLRIVLSEASHKRTKEDLSNSALLDALNSLSQPIQLKYQWQRQGKSPFLWQKATTTALSVLEHCLEHATQTSKAQDEVKEIWLIVVAIAQAIAQADCSSATSVEAILADEKFDIESLTTLRKLIIPALGSPTVPDTTRRLYTSSLFLTSLIHKTQPGELPIPPSEPLQGLYDVRFGCTSNPPPNVRSEVGYFCFSELLALTATTSSSSSQTERVRLAQAAAPYLILRAALPIKAYIADQPLRGRMPQGFSQRQELLSVLRKMRDLKSEPRAIPEVDGAKTEVRRHLVRLYPLVNKAVEVAGRCKGLARDDEVLDEFAGWLRDVGEEFGI